MYFSLDYNYDFGFPLYMVYREGDLVRVFCNHPDYGNGYNNAVNFFNQLSMGMVTEEEVTTHRRRLGQI